MGLMNEAARVLKPGGWSVWPHTDFDTIVVNTTDVELSRRVLHGYADMAQPWTSHSDARMGRKLGGLVHRSALTLVDLDTSVLVGSDLSPLVANRIDNISAALSGHSPLARDVPLWRHEVDDAIAPGTFSSPRPPSSSQLQRREARLTIAACVVWAPRTPRSEPAFGDAGSPLFGARRGRADTDRLSATRAQPGLDDARRLRPRDPRRRPELGRRPRRPPPTRRKLTASRGTMCPTSNLRCRTVPLGVRFCTMNDPLGALLEVAVPQHGLFRVEQAQDVGVDDVRVRKLAARGALERRAQGVYRVVTIPIDAYTELMEAVLWAKGRGVIAGETALALWELADVNPRKIHLVVPPDYNPRGRGGERYQVQRRRLAAADQDEVHGVPTVTPAVAIRQAIAHGLAGDLVEQAVTRAQAGEHIGVETAARLRVALYDRNAAPAGRAPR